MGWVVNATLRPLYARERDPVPVVQEVGSASKADLDTCAKSRPQSASIPETDLPIASRYFDITIPTAADYLKSWKL
jgi:hypothetical protein